MQSVKSKILFVSLAVIMAAIVLAAQWAAVDQEKLNRTAKKPDVNVGLLDGHLAWRQHDGGHTDAPNWKYFIPWFNRLNKR